MTIAYLDHAERFGTAPLQTQPEPAPAPLMRDIVGAFGQREWQVVKLARADRLSSLREESEFMEFIRLLFGFERTRPLANPRLEALRRIAVLSWRYGYNVASSEIEAFFAAGYSPDQYDAMLVHMGRERAASITRIRR